MKYVLVLLVSVLAGGSVYALSLRTPQGGGTVGLGFVPEGSRVKARARQPSTAHETAQGAMESDAPAESAGAGFTYLRVLTGSPSWQERVQGLVGLLILVIVSAAVLAAAVYQVGHMVNSTIENFLTTK
jgi:hypothetical protein